MKEHVKFLHAKCLREKSEIVTYYVCDQCTAYFVTRSSKNRHIKSVHERCGQHQLHHLRDVEQYVDLDDDLDDDQYVDQDDDLDDDHYVDLDLDLDDDQDDD